MFTRKLTGPAFVLGAILITSSCALSAWQIVTRMCILWTCPPVREYRWSDLSIPPELLPPHSIVSGLSDKHENEGAMDSAVMNADWDGGRGTLQFAVWQFGTTWQASYFVGRLDRLEERFGHLPCPSDREARVQADESRFYCGDLKFRGLGTNWDARYDEFVIALYSNIDSELTPEEYARIVEWIDGRVSAILANR